MTIRIKPVEVVVTQDAILRRKCQQALRHHRAAAKKDGATLDYDLADLLKLAQRQTCGYCSAPLSWELEFDHQVPLARSSNGHRLENLEVCCPDCNKLKGQMSYGEYIVFLKVFLTSIDPHATADVRRRLLAGGQVYARGRKRGKR